MEFLVALLSAAVVVLAILWWRSVADSTRRLQRVEREVDRVWREVATLRQPVAPVPPAPQPPALREDDYAAAESELARPTGGGEELPPDLPVASRSSPRSHVPTASVADEPAPPRRPAGVAPAVASGAAPAAESDAATPRPFSMEEFLGGRVLLVLGVIVLLIGLGFFLKLAIEQGMVSPTLRVAIGAAAGLGALIGGDILRRRGLDVFGHGVMGGGLGALFLSTFFAAARYELIPRPVAFGVTALVTAAGVIVALRREAALLAYLGFLGGFLAPAILGANEDALEGLTTWLLVLDAGLFVTVWRRRWPGLEFLTLTAAAVYYGVWSDTYLHVGGRTGMGALALTLLTAATLAVALLPPLLRRHRPMPTAVPAALATGCASAWAAFAFFHPDHRVGVGLGLIGLAAAYALAAWVLRGFEDRRVADAPILDGCAVAVAAGAVPAFFEGASVAPVLALAGAVAIALGGMRRQVVTAAVGVLVVVAAQIHLFAENLPMHDGAFAPFLNGAFPAWASPAVALVVAGLVLRWRSPWRMASNLLLGAGAWIYAPVLVAESMLGVMENRASFGAAHEVYSVAVAAASSGAYAFALAWVAGRRRPLAILLPLAPLFIATIFAGVAVFGVERPGHAPIVNVAFGSGLIVVAAYWAVTWASQGVLRVIALIAAVVAGLLLIASECVAYGEHAAIVGTSREAVRRAAQVWLSVSASAYAAGLLVAGFVRRVPALRWSGLAVFLLTLIKVFVVDMEQLPTAHRIGGFLVLGVLLLGVSYLYQRARRVAP